MDEAIKQMIELGKSRVTLLFRQFVMMSEIEIDI